MKSILTLHTLLMFYLSTFLNGNELEEVVFSSNELCPTKVCGTNYHLNEVQKVTIETASKIFKVEVHRRYAILTNEEK